MTPDPKADSPANSVFEKALAVWRDPRHLGLLAIVGLLGIAVAVALTGIVPTRIYGHDVFVLLDNGWRVLNGLRPHVDYYSPLGPVMFLVSAAGLKLAHYSADGIGYGNALASLIVGSWCYFLGKNRLEPGPRLLLTLFVAALIAAPYSLGNSPFLSSHAMLYNRYGFTLTGLIVIEAMTVSQGVVTGKSQGWLAGISTGVALGLGLFLKASYFLVGAVLAGFGSLAIQHGRRRIPGIVLGWLVTATILLAYLKFDLRAILGDLRIAAGARGPTSFTPTILVWNVLPHLTVLLGVVLLALAVTLLLGNRAGPWRHYRLIAVAVLIFGADMGLLSGNGQSDGLPLCAIFGVLAMNAAARDQEGLEPAEARPLRPAYGAVLCLGALIFLPQFVSDLSGIGYGFWKKLRPSTPQLLVRFTSPRLRPLLLYDGAAQRSANGTVYTTYVNDGVALLERESRPEETVGTMDMTNPFPYALGRKPARAGAAAATFTLTMNKRFRPSDERYFGETDIIMVPKHPAEALFPEFYEAYEPGLKKRYRLAAESDWWWMYRRK